MTVTALARHVAWTGAWTGRRNLWRARMSPSRLISGQQDSRVRRFDKSWNCRDHKSVASSVRVIITDDLDGSPDAETVSFALDGTTYEIDLGKENLAKFEALFAPYIQAARRVSGRSRRSAPRPGRGLDRASVRAWAKEQGLQVSERGRISAEIMQRYDAAH